MMLQILFSSTFMMEGIPENIGVLGAQMFATYVAFSSLVPLNFALTTVEVIAGNTVFLRAAIEFVLAPANFPQQVMMSYVSLCACMKSIPIMFSFNP